MNTLLTTLPDLAPPEEEILQQANGSVPALLQLAAAWGYRLACRDHDQVVAAVGPSADHAAEHQA